MPDVVADLKVRIPKDKIGKRLPQFPDYLIFAGNNEHPKGLVYSFKSNKFLKLLKRKDYWKIRLINKNCICKNLQMSRLIGLAFLPNPKKLPTIDHIDRNKENNRLTNLRWASYTLQMHNTLRKKRGLPHGIDYYQKRVGKYRARICKDGTQYSLGYFTTVAEAQRAYEAKERELYP
jgi:hypothetical protein